MTLPKELVKHTEQDHPDYQALTKATEKMSEIANYVNDKKREAGNSFTLSSSESEFFFFFFQKT
jgi:hypothetical protein